MANERDHSYNRKKILEWLPFCSDLSQPGYQSMSDFHDAPGFEESDPLIDYVYRILDDEHAWISHKILFAAVEALQKTRFPLYARLIPCYFGEDPNPSLVDVWETEAEEGSLPDQIAIKDHRDAVDFLLVYVTAELPKYRHARLKVFLPQRVKGVVRRKQRKRKAAAIDALMGFWDEAVHRYGETPKARAEAVRKTAKETGYSPKAVRAMARDLEGSSEGREEAS